MAQELAYVIITPYSLHKSRTGGILARLITRTGLELVGARMFAPGTELVQKYSEVIVSADDPQDRNIQELIRSGEIHHMHFQDVPRLPRELLDAGTRDIPGDGVSPLPAILRALRSKGYNGPLSVELFYPRLQKGDPFQVCSEIRRKAEAVMRS